MTLRAARCGLLLSLAFLAGCPDRREKPISDKPLPLPPRDGHLGVRRCSSKPGPKNKQIPIFQRPFDNQYPVYYLFDHETPGEVRPYDPASKELAYCGLEMFGLLEGMEGYSWGLPEGTPVLAAQDGEITFAGYKAEYYCPLLAKKVSNELIVELRHDRGDVVYSTGYRSLSSIAADPLAHTADGGAVLLKVGDRVKAGQRIGLSGKSGCVTEPLLFFVVQRINPKTGKGISVDPYGWDYTAPDPWEKNEKGAQSFYLWMEDEAPTLGGRAGR